MNEFSTFSSVFTRELLRDSDLVSSTYIVWDNYLDTREEFR